MKVRYTSITSQTRCYEMEVPDGTVNLEDYIEEHKYDADIEEVCCSGDDDEIIYESIEIV